MSTKKTTTKLNWKLKEAPTMDGLAQAVEKGILTKEEAKQILVNETNYEEPDTVHLETLQEEIKFIREMLLKVMSNSSVKVVKEYIYPYREHPWYKPYWTYMHSMPNDNKFYTLGSSATTTEGSSTFSANSAVNGMNLLNSTVGSESNVMYLAPKPSK